MKKIVLGMGLALSLLIFFRASAVQAVTTQVGIVQGLISKPDDSPADSASVSVVCNSTTKTTTTDSNGFYFVQYPNGVCTVGMSATVTATKDSLTGSNSGAMTSNGFNPILVLDIAVIHVPLIPEFGLVTGTFALLTSISAFHLLRMKKSI